MLSRHGLTIRKLTFRCVHIPAGPKKEARACVLFVLYSLSKNFFAPPEGESGCKGKAFPVPLQTIGGLFSGEKAAGPKRRGALAESGCKSTPFARNGKQNGGFFSWERELFYVKAGRQVVTGNARSGMGRGREGDTHLYNIYKAGEGRGKGMGTRRVAGTDATCRGQTRDALRANSERVAGKRLKSCRIIGKNASAFSKNIRTRNQTFAFFKQKKFFLAFLRI